MARKPRNPNPIKSRKKDARDYEKAVRRAYYEPFVRDVQQLLARADSVTAVYRATEEAVERALARGIPEDLIRAELEKVEGYHRERLKQTFRAALGVDVRKFLTSPSVREFMTRKVGENVDLIKTIPPRFHEGLKARVGQEFADAPFDQSVLKKMFRDEYQSSGYNLRRITRDQTSKLVGELTQVRHSQLGIEQYKWLDSADERVRKSCSQDNGNIYKWTENSPIDGASPGQRVQCRCSAIPIISPATKERLGG